MGRWSANSVEAMALVETVEKLWATIRECGSKWEAVLQGGSLVRGCVTGLSVGNNVAAGGICRLRGSFTLTDDGGQETDVDILDVEDLRPVGRPS